MAQTNPQQNNQDSTGQMGEDSAIRIARINRSGQIWQALLGAFGGIVIAALPIYLVGHDQGSKEGAAKEAAKGPATVTATATTTVSATVAVTGSENPSPDAGGDSNGATSLFDLAPLRDQTDYETTEAKVNTRQYDRVLLGGVHCQGQSVTYQLDRKFKKFTATVGLTDDSLRIPVRFDVYVDGKRAGAGTTVNVGQIKPVEIAVSGAFRMQLWVEDAKDEYCPAFEESQLWAAWIKPTLRP
ncbi:NPCBM/NEW2 domain-containing protein [Nonomuraea sp. NPDC051941]|uniref:NPCBM/NEW2 domain-containing protein n=1 Tax=Nonomuraea sp. NPDC051941 TaxID=3364373 RepID=UPI0037CB2967